MVQGDEEEWGGDESDERPSKSQRKREMLALQKLAEELLGQSVDALQRLSLDEAALKAVFEGQKIRSHSARRRQLRYIAKLLDGQSEAALEEARRAVDPRARPDVRVLHFAERWRERLITQGDSAVEELVAEFPDADPYGIRELLDAVRRESEKGRPPAAARRLFRLLAGLAKTSSQQN